MKSKETIRKYIKLKIDLMKFHLIKFDLMKDNKM